MPKAIHHVIDDDILCEVEDSWMEISESEIRPRVVHEEVPEDQNPTTINPLVWELARLANLDAVPTRLRSDVSGVLPPDASLLWSRIDGQSSLRVILAACAMTEGDALRVLALLVQHRCVTFHQSR